MSNALNKIRNRAKAIQKRHPKRKYQSALKQAGLEYRQGKLKSHGPRKKARASKKVTRKRARRKVAGFQPTSGGWVPVSRAVVIRTRSAVGTTHKRKRRRTAAPRRRRVGATGGSSMLTPLLIAGGLGLLAYAIFKKPAAPPVGTAPPGIVQTGNAYRDQTTQRIMVWASAAAIGADAIIKLINALNNSDDATVNQVADSIDSGEGLPYGFIAGLN